MAIDAARAKSLFLNASDLADAAARAAYLDRECGGDAELRDRVEALLRANDAAPLPSAGQLNQTVDSDPGPAKPGGTGEYTPEPEGSPPHAVATTDYRPQFEPGLVIAGRYTLLQKIGQGGMGEVWVARQSEPVKRKVALKLIKTGMDSKAVLTRFEQERQALALMDHPNIARVLDGGLTPTGQPFFVMELVNGLALNKFCDEAKLTPKARLELFVPICQAVQHAHQKGIVHRDLKPANILITLIDGKPVPKVIDFGVAKATAGKLTDESMNTQLGAVIGTFEYMSPEQAGFAGEDIDTRADIYSLGVILYEMLTGLRPMDAKRLKKAALTEMIRMIREEEPSKPSTRLSTDESLPSLAALRQIEPKKLMALLRGELDWVVMKCLEKDRSRRYETANSLARDLQRYLADEVVEARPPSAGYRLQKFVKRNKGQVVAASLVLLALVAGVVGTTLGLLEATAAAAKERTASAAAQAARTEAENAQAKERAAKVAAQEAAEKEKEAAAREKTAREREATQRTAAEKARDRTRDVLDAMVSDVTGDSLATQKAISAEQKKFLESVLGYYREFAGENPDDERSRARHAQAAARVGMIESRLGRKEESAAANRIARDGFASLAAEFPAVPAYRRDLALSHNNLGLLLADLGQRAAAEEQVRKALAIREKLAAEFPAVPDYRQHLAGSHGNLGLLLAGLGQGAAAQEQYRQALAIFEKLAADFPAVPDYRADIAKSHESLGTVLAGLGQGAAAEEQFRKGLAIQKKLAADFPAVLDYRLGLALSHHNLGTVLAGLGQRAAAEEQTRKALAIFEKLAAEFPAVPNYRSNLAVSHNILGHLLKDLGRGAAVEEQYRQALAIQEKLAADFPAVLEYQADLGGSYCNLGNLILTGGDPAESLKWYGRAIDCLQAVHEKEPRAVTAKQFLRNSHSGRAVAHDRLQKFAEAVKDWDRVIALSPPAQQPQVHLRRATSRLQAGMVAEAVAEVAELTKTPFSPAPAWYDFACVYSVASGKIADKKAEYGDRAMELLQKAVQAGYQGAAQLQKDTDLDPLRDRADFKALLADLEKRFPPPKVVGPVHEVGPGLELRGQLDKQTPSLVYQVKLAAGKTYVLDMVSPDQKAVDPYLVLSDAAGKKLAEDDDSGGGLNARINFRADQAGTYRIQATTFNDGRGAFTLTVREQPK
jgi:tetratricopeptide (TPR) repeat protein